MPHPDDLLHSRKRFIAASEELDDAVYPELYNLSAAFFFRFLPRPLSPARPEFLYLPTPQRPDKWRGEQRLAMIGLMAQWNMAWEAAQLRQQMFDDEFSKYFPSVKIQDDANVFLLPGTRHRLEALVPLYMLLPRQTVERFGLVPLRRMTWPLSLINDAEELLPHDFGARLAAAFASLVWPFMISGSAQRAFRRDDSLVLLAHDLDYWLPHAVTVVQDRLRSLDLVAPDDEDQGEDGPATLAKLRQGMPEGIWVDRSRTGGHVWLGRDEAQEALRDVVATADSTGQLSGIIEAIRANRVQDDFSDRWSFAREDFERKLYDKRSKVRVRFVELEQAEGVVGPHSDITDNVLWRDFLALLDPKERQIVVCLTRSTTKLAEVAAELGYANHSPVSKRLARIREEARRLLR